MPGAAPGRRSPPQRPAASSSYTIQTASYWNGLQNNPKSAGTVFVQNDRNVVIATGIVGTINQPFRALLKRDLLRENLGQFVVRNGFPKSIGA